MNINENIKNESIEFWEWEVKQGKFVKFMSPWERVILKKCVNHKT